MRTLPPPPLALEFELCMPFSDRIMKQSNPGRTLCQGGSSRCHGSSCGAARTKREKERKQERRKYGSRYMRLGCTPRLFLFLSRISSLLCVKLTRYVFTCISWRTDNDGEKGVNALREIPRGVQREMERWWERDGGRRKTSPLEWDGRREQYGFGG